MESLSQILKAIPNTITSKPRGLYIHGSSGTGKTTLARACYKALINAQKRCRFVSTPELLLEIRETFKDSSGSERQVIDYYTKKIDFLFLDDFGAEKQTEFAFETLYIILDRCERMFEAPTLIVTSNYKIGQISEMMTDRIASRLAGLCDVLEVAGDDNRLKRQTEFIKNNSHEIAIQRIDALIQQATKGTVK